MILKSLNTILLTAYAKAPQGTSMHEVYKHAGIVLEIEKETHLIVDSEFTFVTTLAQKYFKSLIVGYDFSQPIDGLIHRVKEHYYAPSTDSVIVALKSAHQRYLNLIL